MILGRRESPLGSVLAGTLNVSLIDGFTLAAGQQFEILNVGGSLVDAFAGLAEGDLFGNFCGTNLLITYAGGDGNDVTLLTALPGDFDIDGDVDGNDFFRWQKNFSTLDGTASLSNGDANGNGNVDGDDFLIWPVLNSAIVFRSRTELACAFSDGCNRCASPSSSSVNRSCTTESRRGNVVLENKIKWMLLF